MLEAYVEILLEGFRRGISNPPEQNDLHDLQTFESKHFRDHESYGENVGIMVKCDVRDRSDLEWAQSPQQHRYFLAIMIEDKPVA